jgi:hypothetical protein
MDSKTTKTCRSLNDKTFKVKDMVPGYVRVRLSFNHTSEVFTFTFFEELITPVFINVRNDGTSAERMWSLNDKTFKVKDMVPGVNAPPLHPFCRSTVVPHIDDIQILVHVLQAYDV